MVRVIDYKIKTESKEFTSHFKGGIETLVNKKTGKTYLTMRKANVSTTFGASCESYRHRTTRI
jgi:hypothetical protein